jgi:hypothetical protein
MASGEAPHWVTLDSGQHILIGESEKATRARASQVKFTKQKMTIALAQEAMVASALGGSNLGDNEPFDVISGGKAIEVKTLISGHNPKITMRQDALARKEAYASAKGLTPVTVVVDARGGTPVYYYKMGVGSFRLSSMTSTSSLSALSRAIHK